MTYDKALYYRQVALKVGLFLVGAALIAGAVSQHRTGRTYGLAGKGLVLRDKEPAYFAFLFYSRLMLGAVMILTGFLVTG